MSIEKPINMLIADFTEQMDAKLYVQTNTLWVLQRFVTWMVRNKIDVSNPRRADIIHYKNSIISEGKTPTTVNRYLSPVRSFFRWLEEQHIYTNVAAGVKSPKDDRAFRKDYLNPNQVIQLLDSIPTTRIAGLRDYAMINLMVCTGLRRIEVLRLTVGDVVNTSSGYVLHIQRKGRIVKEPIRLDYEIFKHIEKYFIARSNYLPTDPMFANHSQHPTNSLSAKMVSMIVKKYLKQLPNDSKRLTCHSLRHSAAINLINDGKDILSVRDMLGHYNVETTQLYLKAIEAERRFNNPAASDLVKLYKKHNETRQIQHVL